MNRRPLLTLTTILVTTLAAGCNEGTGPAGAFVVTGHIQNRTQSPIPADARLVVVWGVSAGSPDYSYVYGEGTINRGAGTFRILFDQPPPLEALNHGALGVGFMIATTDQSMKDGDILTSSSPPTGVIGITGQHAVIFVQNRDTLPRIGWVAAFPDGYALGVGVKVPGEVFDIFQPTSRSSPILIIDDPANIEIVNWT